MQPLLRLQNLNTGSAERDADASYMFPKTVRPAPMPSAAPMPSGAPTGMPPAYGAPTPSSAAPMAPSAPTMAAPSMYGGAPGGIGQNGFGLHPDVTHDQLTNYLMGALRNHESTNDYKKLVQGYEPGKRTASGAYQVTDSTWNHYQGYPRAVDAPPQVQDQWAKENIGNSLKRYGYDPFKAVASHYYPAWAHDPSKWNDTPISNGAPIKNAQTIRQYLERVLPSDRVNRYMASVGGNNEAS